MTPDTSPAVQSVTEEEVDAGAIALYDLNPTHMTVWPQNRRKVLWEELDEQTDWSRENFRARSRAACEAAAQVRVGLDGEAVRDVLRHELADLRNRVTACDREDSHGR